MDLGFTHLFNPGQSNAPVLLLLHGTGGNEHDLVDLAHDVAPNAGTLSVRGKVLENSMPRFFKRLAEGVFDLEDLKLRTDELAAFITAAREHYAFGNRKLYALGYSNGANIASSVLFSYPDSLDGAIILRGMVPFTPATLPDLNSKDILLLSGAMDQIMLPDEAQTLAQMFEQAGAGVKHITQSAGHGLVQADVTAMTDWIKARS